MKQYQPTVHQNRQCCCCCRPQGVVGNLLERPGVSGAGPWPHEGSATVRACHTESRHMARIVQAYDAKALRVKNYSGLLAFPATKKKGGETLNREKCDHYHAPSSGRNKDVYSRLGYCSQFSSPPRIDSPRRQVNYAKSCLHGPRCHSPHPRNVSPKITLSHLQKSWVQRPSQRSLVYEVRNRRKSAAFDLGVRGAPW